MSIRALIVGLAVYCSPIWAKIDVNLCGVSQGCFIQPPGCNNGNDFTNCSVVVTFSNFTEPTSMTDWLEIQLTTSLSRPIGGMSIAGDTGVYVAFGFSYDQNMGNDSIVDCVYGPNSKNVMGEVSSNVPGQGNQPYDTATGDNKLFMQKDVSADDNMLYCRLWRLITPNPADGKIFDASQSYYLFATRGPAKNTGTRYAVTQHYFKSDDLCSTPFLSTAQVSLLSPYTPMVDAINGVTKAKLQSDACPMKSDTVTTTNPPGSSVTTQAGGGASSVHVAELAGLMFTVIALALRLL